jgi:hypothetical protein
MRTVRFVFCVLICSAFASSASETSPAPAHPAMDSSAPALPESDASSPGVPDLLPESSAIPYQSPGTRIKAASTDLSKSTTKTHKKQSEHSSEQTRKHLEKIRSLAEQSPRAEYLLDRARHASTRTVRRRYRQRYEAFVRARMNVLDPDLKVSTIAADRDAASGRSSKSKVHNVHHRAHNYAHHTNRRHRIYFDEYGPPEMGPYGPPPYDPPAWWPAPPGF